MKCPECQSDDTSEQELRPPMPGTKAYQCVECEAAWLAESGEAKAVATGSERRAYQRAVGTCRDLFE